MKKNIVVIGGSSGIGFEITQNLKDEHNVIVLSRNKGDLDDNELKHLEFDVLKDDIENLELPEEIHGLVYCPGSINLKPFKLLKQEDFQNDLEINFLGLVKSLQGLLPKLKKADQAGLVFFSTVAVKTGMPFHTSVAAAKGAIEGFARSLAAEYAPKIRVNVIAPSLTNTPLAKKILSSESKIEKMKERHPLKSIGNPGDIASLAEYLLSEKSQFVTGQVFTIDGGISALNLN